MPFQIAKTLRGTWQKSPTKNTQKNDSKENLKGMNFLRYYKTTKMHLESDTKTDLF